MAVDSGNKSMCDVWTISTPEPGEISEWVRAQARTLVWHRYIFWSRKLSIPSDAKTIETGCGFGKFSMLLGLSGARVMLLDYNKDAIHAAKDAHKMLGLTPDSLVSGILEIPESMNGTFDVVCSFGTMEHFRGENREAAIRRCADLLRPGGMMFFTVPNRYALFYRIAIGLHVRLGRMGEGFFEIPYSRGELLRIAGKTGLEPLQVESVAGVWSDFNYWIVGNVIGLLMKFVRKETVAVKPDGGLSLSGLKAEIAGSAPPAEPGFLIRRFSHILLIVGRKK
jgi:SAM-dependent methyltransferase